MWQVLLLATANQEFCDKVTNFEPVRVCSSYEVHEVTSQCAYIFNKYTNLTIEKNTWRTVSNTQDKNTFIGCGAECPDQTEKGCFEIMKKFTDNYNSNDNFMMGFTSIVDGKRELAFFEEKQVSCTPIMYSTEMLKEACVQGFRSHHGLQPSIAANRGRRSEPEKFNNLFEKEKDDGKTLSTIEIVLIVLGSMVGLALIGYAVVKLG